MPTVSDGTRPKIRRLSKFIRTFIGFILKFRKDKRYKLKEIGFFS